MSVFGLVTMETNKGGLWKNGFHSKQKGACKAYLWSGEEQFEYESVSVCHQIAKTEGGHYFVWRSQTRVHLHT